MAPAGDYQALFKNIQKYEDCETVRDMERIETLSLNLPSSITNRIYM